MTLNTIFPVIYTIESIDLPSSGVDYEVGPTGLDYMTPYRITVDETLSYTLGIHSSDTSPGLVTDIITAPNPWQLCIIEQGDLYVCDVRYPQSFAKIDELYDGIVSIKPIVDQGIILFITHIGMLALDSTGVRWKTERIALDGITVEGITDDWVNCRPQSEMEYGTFDVNLLTGEIQRSEDNKRVLRLL